jgi:hypothetical protein
MVSCRLMRCALHHDLQLALAPCATRRPPSPRLGSGARQVGSVVHVASDALFIEPGIVQVAAHSSAEFSLPPPPCRRSVCACISVRLYLHPSLHILRSPLYHRSLCAGISVHLYLHILNEFRAPPPSSPAVR